MYTCIQVHDFKQCIQYFKIWFYLSNSLGGPGAYAWSGGIFGYPLPDLDANTDDYNSFEDFERPDVDEDMFQTLGCTRGEFGSTSSKVKCDK